MLRGVDFGKESRRACMFPPFIDLEESGFLWPGTACQFRASLLGGKARIAYFLRVCVLFWLSLRHVRARGTRAEKLWGSNLFGGCVMSGGCFRSYKLS